MAPVVKRYSRCFIYIGSFLLILKSRQRKRSMAAKLLQSVPVLLASFRFRIDRYAVLPIIISDMFAFYGIPTCQS